MADLSQFALDVPCVAMVTASHNDNGWTGVKMGAHRPLTFGCEEITRLKDIVLGRRLRFEGLAAAIGSCPTCGRAISRDMTDRPKLKRHIKAVAACGNGTAGAFAPACTGSDRLRGRAARHPPVSLQISRYNPNPEDLKTLEAMRDAVRASRADVGLGFDGDGDRRRRR